MMMRVKMKIMNSSSYGKVLPIVAKKYLFFYKNYITILPSPSNVVEQFYLLKMETVVRETRTTHFKKKPHFLIDQPRTCRIFMLCYI